MPPGSVCAFASQHQRTNGQNDEEPYDQADADEFCRRAGRNHMIFEMLVETSSIDALPAPGAMRCTWSFSGAGTAGRNRRVAGASIEFLEVGLSAL